MSARGPAVSVVLPTFNRARFLPGAFEAIRAQGLHDWEVIVVDDGSTDDTADIVAREAASTERPVRYVKQANAGAYAARNTALDLASGEFIAFYDSDDLWLPRHLDRCVGALTRHAEVDWVFAPCRRVDLASGQVIEASSFYPGGKPRPFLSLRNWIDGDLHVIDDPRVVECQVTHGLYCGLQNSVMRRSVFAAARFSEAYRVVEDELFLIRALARGVRVAYFTEEHVVYRVHDANSSAAAKTGSPLPILHELVAGFEELHRAGVVRGPRNGAALRRRLNREYFWHLGYAGLLAHGRREEALAAFRRGLSVWPWNARQWKTYLAAAWGLSSSPAGS